MPDDPTPPQTESLPDHLAEDWPLDERDRFMDEHEGDELDDPAEVVVGSDE